MRPGWSGLVFASFLALPAWALEPDQFKPIRDAVRDGLLPPKAECEVVSKPQQQQPASDSPKGRPALTVHVRGLKQYPAFAKKHEGGTVRIQICATKQCYDSRGKPPHPYLKITPASIDLKVTDHEADFEIKDLDPGEYSVFIHHDRDRDGSAETETNLLGQPRDGISWSNNVDPRSLWREPKWDEVKIRIVKDQPAEIEVRPIYMRD